VDERANAGWEPFPPTAAVDRARWVSPVTAASSGFRPANLGSHEARDSYRSVHTGPVSHSDRIHPSEAGNASFLAIVAAAPFRFAHSGRATGIRRNGASLHLAPDRPSGWSDERMGVALSADPPADITRRIPLGNTAGNLLPLLNIQRWKSAHNTLAHRSTKPLMATLPPRKLPLLRVGQKAHDDGVDSRQAVVEELQHQGVEIDMSDFQMTERLLERRLTDQVRTSMEKRVLIRLTPAVLGRCARFESDGWLLG